MILMKICCILFGMASWIACVGVWVELPLLVNVMPEVRAHREAEFGSNWGETGMKLRSGSNRGEFLISGLVIGIENVTYSSISKYNTTYYYHYQDKKAQMA